MLFTSLTKFKNRILHIIGFETLFYTLSYVKEKANIFILDISDQKIMYVFLREVSIGILENHVR